MPYINSIELGVSLRIPSDSTRMKDGSCECLPESAIKESKMNMIWQPTRGMGCPLYTTTVVSPLADISTDKTSIPFHIALQFGQRDKRSHYMQGDIRAELLIDGVPSGVTIFRDNKVLTRKKEGFIHEFTGFQVERRFEKGFVFNKIPFQLKSNWEQRGVECNHKNTFQAHARPPNIAGSWVDDSIRNHPGPIMGSEDFYAPVTPENVAEYVSHIEVVYTVGRWHKTHDKYYSEGVFQDTAFYNPPLGIVSMDPMWKGTPYDANTSLAHQTTLSESRKSTLENSFMEDRWKPVGLWSNKQTCKQKRVADFSGRMHLARFWIFVGRCIHAFMHLSYKDNKADRLYAVPSLNMKPPLESVKRNMIIKLKIPSQLLSRFVAKHDAFVESLLVTSTCMAINEAATQTGNSQSMDNNDNSGGSSLDTLFFNDAHQSITKNVGQNVTGNLQSRTDEEDSESELSSIPSDFEISCVIPMHNVEESNRTNP
ncbi:hypothetical protein EDC01DRAFT_631835 [Geopyxis carbonaria]|nr:hypothetical protein EDC01DRAFT_631835 [Geopyxis carbonaria]